MDLYDTPITRLTIPPSAKQDEEQRDRENEVISQRYHQELEKRNASRSMSPDYINSLPKSLIEKLRVTPEQQEEILYYYASTSSIPKTAEASGVSLDKVRAVVYNPDSQSTISEIRDALRISVLSKISETQHALLEAIQDPQKLHDSSITQLASVFTDITESQINLTTAQREATGPSAALSNPSEVFTGDELEYMAFLRRRLSAGPTAEPIPLATEVDDMRGHEFVDTAFSVDEDPQTMEDVTPISDFIPDPSPQAETLDLPTPPQEEGE